MILFYHNDFLLHSKKLMIFFLPQYSQNIYLP